MQALWFFTSDLVFVLLFPQLVCALFDSKANLAGSVAAFSVSLVLRLGGGEPLFGIPALIPYPDWVPFKTLAAGVGLILLPVVSRLHGSLESAANMSIEGGYRADLAMSGFARSQASYHSPMKKSIASLFMAVRDCRSSSSTRGREASSPRRTAGPVKAPVPFRR